MEIGEDLYWGIGSLYLLRHDRIALRGVSRTAVKLAAVEQSFGATTRRDWDMGAMAEGLVAFAQPLLDQTDGSPEQIQNAFTISQLCFNLALVPEDAREKALREMRSSLEMDDEEIDAFWQSIVVPMIQRHQEMFPGLHRRGVAAPSQNSPSRVAFPGTAGRAEAYPGTDRYAPCPCNSGQKYKFCCGKKGR